MGLLRDLLDSGFVEEVGLLIHETPVEPDPATPIALLESRVIAGQDLSERVLDGMERETLYRFLT